MLRSLAQIGDTLLLLGVIATLLWFLWHLVFRRLYRVRHIRQIQMNRLMREAAERKADQEKYDEE
ncbi:MAG: hypothetical protein LAN37_12910 [Acidobacteriia bacterium]|nr:hypothetical protein [Terriglobia bacterium]